MLYVCVCRLSHRLDRITRNFFQVHHFFTTFFCFAEPRGGSFIRLQIEFWCEWTNFRKLSCKPSLFYQHCKVGKSWRFLGDFAWTQSQAWPYNSKFFSGAPLFYHFFLLCGTSRRFVHSLANWILMRMDELPQAFVQAFAVLSTLQSWQIVEIFRWFCM